MAFDEYETKTGAMVSPAHASPLAADSSIHLPSRSLRARNLSEIDVFQRSNDAIGATEVAASIDMAPGGYMYYITNEGGAYASDVIAAPWISPRCTISDAEGIHHEPQGVQ